ncbi:hypothetical protein [Dyadobacter frigoris]|uniref:Uncharacterized protein n=1 Tax=Dyadobacter frigoris TaxID=2576211 RepID=A0A4U6CXN5_9BACT|nr:hypothetical protein [Dyadobacter frigoris]TKT89462.1 hypothetical protein FDK13_24275 [Dyadobacter frigoris]
MINPVVHAIKSSTGLSNEQIDAKIIALPLEQKTKVRALIVANAMPDKEGLELLTETGLLSH